MELKRSPMSESIDRIAELIRQGKKIEAIKLLRETTGVDLKRAKDEIDRLAAAIESEQTSISSDTADESATVSSEVEELARQGRKIEAIKLLRAQKGIGLKEAKERVEAVTGGTGAGCMSSLLLLIWLGVLISMVAMGM
ncbi:MAG: hypothetical protein WBW88_16805 [Rhodothermales bacterium]